MVQPTNGGGVPAKISYILSGAWTSFSIILALLAVIVFQVRNDADRDHRIRSLEQNYDALLKRFDVLDKEGSRTLNERLSHVNDLFVAAERRFATVDDSHERRFDLMSTRLNDIDSSLASMRQVDGVTRERQDNLLHRLDVLEKDERSAHLEVIRSDISRLFEQQARIIQALDNTYNTLQEALRGGQITRKPTPTNPPTPW